MKVALVLAVTIFAFASPAHAQDDPNPDPSCTRGLAGPFGLVAACCSARCGSCGGGGCSRRPGGSQECCGGRINTRNRSCDVVGPPCIVQRDPGCSTGLANTAEGICCASECGVCGGAVGGGCEQRFNVPGGTMTDTRCCTDPIRNANRPCSDFPPPCSLPLVGTGDPQCTTGIRRGDVACCASSCGTCGGRGCSRRPGGASNCCVSGVTASGRSCNETTAPCIF